MWYNYHKLTIGSYLRGKIMKINNKIISLIITVTLIISMIPMNIFAIEEEPQLGSGLTSESMVLTVTEDTSNWKTVHLKWNQISAATGYAVYVDSADALLVITSAEGNMIADYTVATEGVHSIKIKATTSGEPVYSNEVTWAFYSKNKVSNVKAYSTYGGIDIEWTGIGSEAQYTIYEGSRKIGQTASNSYYVKVSDRSKHSYAIHAVINGVELSQYAKSESKTMFLGIQYNLTFRSKCKLTCWTSGHKKHKKTFKKGQKLVAYEFRKGCYKYLENGHKYSIKRIRLKDVNAKGWYNYKKYYSAAEATRYVNRRKLTSKKNTLILVSTKSQHIYLFKKSKGKWKIDKHWKVSTGSPNTPTPAGKFKIKYKWHIHNTLHYWSACSTFSLHSKNPKWKLGSPKSGGCIRNEKSQAKYIYNHYKCGTTVFVH